MVRHGRGADLLHHFLKTRQLERQRVFLRRVDARRAGNRVGSGHAAFLEDALNARVGVLQVRAGVAVEGEHRVPVEHVVAGAALGQVRVLHRADAHRPRHVRHLFGAEVRVLFRHQPPCPRLRFGQQVEQARAAALARLERALVRAEHGAEGMVLERDALAVAGRLRQGEELAEVQRLTGIDDVEHALGAEGFGAVA